MTERTDEQDADRFDLASALRAGAEDRLGFWVGELLASPGSDNPELAVAFGSREGYWLGPVRLELDRLIPMAGPDEDEVVVPIDEDEWEDDVGDMADALDEGWEPPPLLVSARDGGLHLEDGNHRHETLRRAGETHGWVIVWFPSIEERTAFADSLTDEHLPTDDPELADLAEQQLDTVATASEG